MSKSRAIEGPLFPLIPFFNSKREVDMDAIRMYVDFLYSHGARVFLLNHYMDMLTTDEIDMLYTDINKHLHGKECLLVDVPSLCIGKYKFIESHFLSYTVLFGSIYPHVSIKFYEHFKNNNIARCYDALRFEYLINSIADTCKCSVYIVIKSALSFFYNSLRIERSPYFLLPVDKYNIIIRELTNISLGIYTL